MLNEDNLKGLRTPDDAGTSGDRSFGFLTHTVLCPRRITPRGKPQVLLSRLAAFAMASCLLISLRTRSCRH